MKIIRQLKNITLQFQFHSLLEPLFKRLTKLRGILIATTGKLAPATLPTNFPCKLRKNKRSRGHSLLTQSLLILSSFVLIVLTSCAPSSDTTALTPLEKATQLANLIKSSNPTISGLSVTTDNFIPASPRLLITGLTNSVSGDPVTTTINIDQDKGITTTPTSFTVTAENLISPTTVRRSLAVTFEGEETISYVMTTQIRGAAVSDWFTAVNLSTYITAAAFGGESGTLTLDGTNLLLSGGNNFTNVPNGSVVLTMGTLPDGYSLTGADELTDPDKMGLAAVTAGSAGMIKITEIGNTTNTASYDVMITLSEYLSPLTPASINATYGGITAMPTDITIETNKITISGFTNGDNLSGTVTITEPSDYTVTPPLTFTIEDPGGLEAAITNLGTTVVKNSTGVPVFHIITIEFSSTPGGRIQLSITSADINRGVQIAFMSGTTLPVETPACELLAEPMITLIGTDSDIIAGGKLADATPFPLYYDRERDTLTGGIYTLARNLILEDSDGTVLNSSFTIMLQFPECTTFAGGTGDDAANAYQIDNAPRLELAAHLVNNRNGVTPSGSANTYGASHYKITADINMGLPGFPLSEMGSKTPDRTGSPGKGFLPIGRTNIDFSGTFDCASNTISGLYINRPNTDDIGLIGYASNTSTVQNCFVTDVNITGSDAVGGLIATKNGILNNSYSTGSVSGNRDVGGLVGNNNNRTISDSYSTATVSGDSNIGGLVGEMSFATISNSYATGSVTGMTNVGGLVGMMNTATISNSYATGSVTGITNVGGLTGLNDSFILNDIKVVNSYATGNVSGGNTRIGLFIGYNRGGYVTSSIKSVAVGVTDSYYNSDSTLTVSGSVVAAKGVGSDTSSIITASLTGLSTANLQVVKGTMTGETYFTWDDALWNFTAGQYPRLINVVCANRQYNQAATDCTSTLQ